MGHRPAVDQEESAEINKKLMSHGEANGRKVRPVRHVDVPEIRDEGLSRFNEASVVKPAVKASRGEVTWFTQKERYLRLKRIQKGHMGRGKVNSRTGNLHVAAKRAGQCLGLLSCLATSLD